MTLNSLLANYLDDFNIDSYQTTHSFPYYTSGEDWITLGQAGWDDWITGFWTGIHWLAEQQDITNTETSIELTQKIQPIYEQNFNIGFRYQYSWLPAYEATGIPEYKRKTLKAAQRLSNCFCPKLGLLCHRQNSELVAASDALMNIPLLLWAVNYSPNHKKYQRILKRLLNKSIKFFVKGNGSTRHRIFFDHKDYSIKTVDTHQGLPGGCWSRGLAWTVHGLVLGGIFLDNDRYLETAKKVVGYHRKNSFSVVPGYDYAISTLKRPELTDTSAASILASSLLTLGSETNDEEAWEYGNKITEKLLKSYQRKPDEEGLIGGGCFHYPREEGINEATIWGDFYLLEALHIQETESMPIHLNWLTNERTFRAQAS